MYKFIFNGKQDDPNKIYTCIEQKGDFITYLGEGIQIGYTKIEFITKL